MEKILHSKFLDDRDIADHIYDILADDILGKEQYEKIRLRYYDMQRNFCSYTMDEAKKYGGEVKIWTYSKGLEPFKPKGWSRYYEDTSTVPIAITHPCFKDLTERTEKRGAIGLDLPTWFNLKDNGRRIMIVAQDPLRGNEWYSDVEKGEDYLCLDALVSSPFGLHNKGWRESKRCGARMRLLVEKLIGKGFGVYLTDCRKYFVFDAKESRNYSEKKRQQYKDILEKEIKAVQPVCIVAMGNQAYTYFKELLDDDHKVRFVPHFSGAATWKAKEVFGIPKEWKISIEELADEYAEKISCFAQAAL